MKPEARFLAGVLGLFATGLAALIVTSMYNTSTKAALYRECLAANKEIAAIIAKPDGREVRITSVPECRF